MEDNNVKEKKHFFHKKEKKAEVAEVPKKKKKEKRSKGRFRRVPSVPQPGVLGKKQRGLPTSKCRLCAAAESLRLLLRSPGNAAETRRPILITGSIR